MEMAHGLAAIWACINNGAETIGEAKLCGDRGRGTEQFGHGSGIFTANSRERADMAARNQQNMGRRFRVNVVEGEKVRIFVDFLCGNLAGGDFAEEAVGSHGGNCNGHGRRRTCDKAKPDTNMGEA